MVAPGPEASSFWGLLERQTLGMPRCELPIEANQTSEVEAPTLAPRILPLTGTPKKETLPTYASGQKLDHGGVKLTQDLGRRVV